MFSELIVSKSMALKYIGFVEQKSKETLKLWEENKEDPFIKGQITVLYDLSCFGRELVKEYEEYYKSIESLKI